MPHSVPQALLAHLALMPRVGDAYAHLSGIADLCAGLASVAQKLCTTYVDPQGITPLLTSHLITMDKCPGVHPIGVGETPRWKIGKAIMMVIKADIWEAAGALQLCAGQEAGSEAAIHAVCLPSRTVTQKVFCLPMPTTPSTA